jgi:hypothetical protein
MSFGWGIVSAGKHPDITIAPAMAAAGGSELIAASSRDQQRAEAFARKVARRPASRVNDDAAIRGSHSPLAPWPRRS